MNDTATRKPKSPKSEILEIIGNNIRQLRCNHDMKSSELANAIGFHPVSISKYENGHINMTVTALERFAIFFAVPIEDFFKK